MIEEPIKRRRGRPRGPPKIKKPRGRPVTYPGRTNAERQKAVRQRKRARLLLQRETDLPNEISNVKKKLKTVGEYIKTYSDCKKLTKIIDRILREIGSDK
jgi:hypothetical protein